MATPITDPLLKSEERPTAGHTVIQPPTTGTLGELNPTRDVEDSEDGEEDTEDGEEEEKETVSLVHLRQKIGLGLLQALTTERLNYNSFSGYLRDSCGDAAAELTPNVLRQIVLGEWSEVQLEHMAMFDEALVFMWEDRKGQQKALDDLKGFESAVIMSKSRFREERNVHLATRVREWAKKVTSDALSERPASDNPTEDALHGVAHAAAVCDLLAGLREVLASEGYSTEGMDEVLHPTEGPPAETVG